MGRGYSTSDFFKYERHARQNGCHLVIGIDEAGRGPLAGPVVAAAVALKSLKFEAVIGDSKKMSASQRETAFLEIYKKAYVGVGIVGEMAIDRLNILEATFVAMTNAVWQLLSRVPENDRKGSGWQQRILLLVDGNRFKTDLLFPYQTIVGGDAQCFSISCASIIAKVTRDRILEAYHQILPQYGFRQHKGYPTQEHKEAIRKHGLSFIHRRTFRAAL